MTLRIASCSCGQLTASTMAEPVRVSVCHCLACQRRTRSVFGAQARFPAASVTTQGIAKELFRVGDSGARLKFRFCPGCGATVPYIIEGQEDLVAIPVGAFADSSFPEPRFSVFD
jgi:hypothetical protein